MPQNTNLNVNPYFDDFDPNKKFNRVLFKPGTPVQARELTTLQSILQDQIEKFGSHIFKEGSMVIPGSIAYDERYYAVKVESTFFGVPVELYLDKVVGLRIRGKQSGVTAVVKKVLTAAESVEDVTTLYIKYQKSNSEDFETQSFTDGENLVTEADFTYGTTTIEAGSDFATCVLTNATATASAFSVEEGVFFARGAFVQVESETILLDQYTNTPSYRVGFQVVEEIVTAVEDDSLYDNAAGFSNFTAPGADRLKISLVLSKKALDNFQDQNFIELFRTKQGEIKKIVQNTVYSEIAKELARRTHDESGDYYIRPFLIEAEETLNDRHSQFGAFFSNEQTDDGNNPTKDMVSIKVGPGKAYVKGFEVETRGAIYVDADKPRETRTVEAESVPFQAGNLVRVNNVYGGASVGIATTGYVDLRSQRLGSDRDAAAGQSVGRARVYDYKVSAGAYADASSTFDLFLFDIQTDTELTLNEELSLSAPALVEGKRSGARGFLRSQSGTTLTLHQTAGQFIVDEPIAVDGVDNGRIITAVKEFDITDAKSIRQEVGVQTFSADTVLEERKRYTQQFNFNSTTVTSSSGNWSVGIKEGDIISYVSGNGGTRFNRVAGIGADGSSLTVAAVEDVTGVCDGDLPGNVNVAGISVVSPRLRGSSSGYLYAEMPQRFVESVDLTRSDIFVRREYRGRSTDGDGQTDLPSLSGTDFVYTPFDEERYTVLYEDGTVEPLTSDQFAITSGGKGATLSGLTASESNVVVVTTQQKSKVTAKNKVLSRCQSLVVNKSKHEYSGVSTANQDGLDYSNAYGLRVQDREISLNTADVVRVLAVFESSSAADPIIPSITLTGLNGPNSDNTDLIIGEQIIGNVSGASATILELDGSNGIRIVKENPEVFIKNEEVTFSESGVVAKISSLSAGDKEVTASFMLDGGQRREFVDFGRLVRRQNAAEPSRRLRVFFDKFIVESDDSGEIVTASSYSSDVYDIVPGFAGIRNTDVIDLRPRVADYSGSLSPFEWFSRNFSSNGQSIPNVLVSDENITFDYRHYLGRVDRLFLNRDTTFTLVEGTSSVDPVAPEGITGSFELAEITYAPYVFDVDRDITIEDRSNRRYTMLDIGNLENRIENLETVTTLSLLEAKTVALTVKDPDTGLDKFKTGFAVDNFSTFDLADKTVPSLNYNIENGTMVPRANFDSVDLLVGSESLIGLNGNPDPTVDPFYATDIGSPNLRKSGNLITMDYTEVEDFKQPFASRAVNVNPFDVVTWAGKMSLNPNEDYWVEKEFVTIDGGFGQTEVITQTSAIPKLRSQNIEFVATRLKPTTKMTAEFSSKDMSENRKLAIPKLLEVTPVKGAFQVGETVRGEGNNAEIRFRLAAPNHKDGPYNAPVAFFNTNPYNNTGISSSYSDTTTLLNIDTKSLTQKSNETFYGRVVKDMKLIGETSGAEATISEVRLVSDETGALVGSLHIPPGQPNFSNGTNLAEVSAKPSDIPGIPTSRARANFTSSGELIVETTIIRRPPPPPPPPPPFNDQQDSGDPLAQSFTVTEEPGIFMTSVDLFFATKSENLPVMVEIVTLVNGFPSTNILAQKLLDAVDVKTSTDGKTPTTFTFDFPVYLETGEYAFTIKADTQDYNCWVARMGEEDISTKDLPELQKVIINKQPSLGSLFKSQNASTWTPSQLEDLKYVARKAKFVTGEGTFKMFNPQLDADNEKYLLDSNPIEIFSKKVTLGLSSSVTNEFVVVGSEIKQSGRTSAGFVEAKLGPVAIGGTGLNITNAGVGYPNGAGQAITFQTQTGSGSGLTGIVTVTSGTIDSVSVNATGTGYAVGDTVTGTIGADGLGRSLVFTVGVVTSTNSLRLTDVTGQDFNTSADLLHVPTDGPAAGIGSTMTNINPTTVTINNNQFDGTHFRLQQRDHGMHAANNTVRIAGAVGDQIPTTITVGYAASSIENISVGNSATFNFFEGAQVTADNPGYALINKEIIAYTGVGNNVLTGITTRGIDGTLSQSYTADTEIQKYEFGGVSLRRINKEHNFASVTNSIDGKITLDDYYLKIEGDKVFTRSGFGGGSKVKASKNIQFESITPHLRNTIPENTTMFAKVRTTSGTSADGSERSFQDQGYEPVSIANETKFSTPRIVASRENEIAKLGALPASKSFTMEVTIGTTDENVSPTIDVFASNITTRGNRTNAPVSNYITDRRSNTLLEDPHSFNYLTQVIGLENPASSLRVLVDVDKSSVGGVRVLYRLQRADGSEVDKVFELMPGFNNLNVNEQVINPALNNGTPDRNISAAPGQFVEHEFTANNLPQFTAYQIKIECTSTSSAAPVRLRDFRVIALA